MKRYGLSFHDTKEYILSHSERHINSQTHIHNNQNTNAISTLSFFVLGFLPRKRKRTRARYFFPFIFSQFYVYTQLRTVKSTWFSFTCCSIHTQLTPRGSTSFIILQMNETRVWPLCGGPAIAPRAICGGAPFIMAPLPGCIGWPRPCGGGGYCNFIKSLLFPKRNSYARLLRRISLIGITHRGWSRSHHWWAGTVLLRGASLWSGHLWAHSLVRHAWVHISWSWISHVSYLRWRRNPLPGGRIGPAWAPMTCWFGPAMLFGGDIIEVGPLCEVIGLLKKSNWIIFRVWKKSKFFFYQE